MADKQYGNLFRPSGCRIDDELWCLSGYLVATVDYYGRHNDINDGICRKSGPKHQRIDDEKYGGKGRRGVACLIVY